MTVTQLSLSPSMAFSYSNSCTVCRVYVLSYNKYNIQWQWHNPHSAPQWHSSRATAAQLMYFTTPNETCSDNTASTFTEHINVILTRQQLCNSYLSIDPTQLMVTMTQTTTHIECLNSVLVGWQLLTQLFGTERHSSPHVGNVILTLIL